MNSNTVLSSELQFWHGQQFHQIISQYADHNHTHNSGHLFQNMTTIITSQRVGHHVTDNIKMVNSFGMEAQIPTWAQAKTALWTSDVSCLMLWCWEKETISATSSYKVQIALLMIKVYSLSATASLQHSGGHTSGSSYMDSLLMFAVNRVLIKWVLNLFFIYFSR